MRIFFSLPESYPEYCIYIQLSCLLGSCWLWQLSDSVSDDLNNFQEYWSGILLGFYISQGSSEKSNNSMHTYIKDIYFKELAFTTGKFKICRVGGRLETQGRSQHYSSSLKSQCSRGSSKVVCWRITSCLFQSGLQLIA